ncbi:MAG: stage III sporulation protein AA [Clostridia bacterium]|nr:stage III sporulation protein AA [Clostridia bacterium]
MKPDRLQAIAGVLPPQLKGVVAVEGFARVEEIRLRVGKPVQLIMSDGEKMLEDFIPRQADCQKIVQSLCENSLYAYENELRQGYVTYAGCRVGIVGKAVCENSLLRRVSEVNALNIRAAEEWRDAAERVFPHMIGRGGRAISTLIVSRPGAGKTTLLRDIARRFSNGMGTAPRKVCVIDERQELCACKAGVPEFDVGVRTDVLYGCPKAQGMSLAVRTMSPDVIITDEIGCMEDAAAIRDALTYGAAVIASAHGVDAEELKHRSGIGDIVKAELFEKLIVIDRDEKGTYIKGISGPGIRGGYNA